MAEELDVTLDAGVMTIRFNRPQALNALTRDTVIALNTALDRAAEEARAVILTGDARAFCSGADVSAMTDGELKGVGLDVINEAIGKIRDLRVPTVAAVSGPAAGVGCSFALICDYVIMSEKSYLMLAFTRIGLMPDGGSTALVAASAGRHRALRMALTGEKVHAAQAYDWGLATEVTAPEAYFTRAQEIASQLAAGPTLALGETEWAINQATLHELDAALNREATGQDMLKDSADAAEGVTAFLAKRTPEFRGH